MGGNEETGLGTSTMVVIMSGRPYYITDDGKESVSGRKAAISFMQVGREGKGGAHSWQSETMRYERGYCGVKHGPLMVMVQVNGRRGLLG